MDAECPTCGKMFEAVGKHWARSKDCTYPEFTDYQKEVITGLLMGDGCIDSQPGQNPLIKIEMITELYLDYLDREVFPLLGTGVKLYMTGEENAEQKRETGFRPNADANDYSDLYRLRTRRNPNFQPFADWYSTGKKVWPDDIDLTPTVLKHWFVGDGSFNNHGSRHYIAIGMSNEREHKDKIERMFGRVGLEISNWTESQRKDGSWRCRAEFTRPTSEEMWEYMGDPLPGFEYKWPEEYHESRQSQRHPRPA